MILDLLRWLLGRPAPRGEQTIDCQDGLVRIGPSPFFDGRIALTVCPDIAIVPAEPMLIHADEARQTAAALIAAALEVKRDG